MISEVNTLLLQLVKRAENNDPAVLHKTFVDTGSLSALLKSPSNQIIYGRRGTGKTHALLFAKTATKAPEYAIYQDLRCTGSNSSIYSDNNRPVSERATRLLLDVLEEIHDQLVDRALEASADTEVLRQLDLLAVEITQIRVEGDVVIMRQSNTNTKTSDKNSASVNVAPGQASLSIGGEAERSNEIGSNDKYVARGKTIPRVSFGPIVRILTSIIEKSGINRLWIFIDEWTVVPGELQPFLADLLRRCIFPIRRVVVKIAAIEQRAQFKLSLNNGDYLGFELGADISADIDLDDFMVFNSDKDRSRAFFARLIFNHVRAISGTLDDQEPDIDRKIRVFINSAFSQEAAFDELVRASEGVPRDAIQMLSICAQKADEGKIGIPIIRDAAKAWYQRDKENPIPPDGKALLFWIIENVIKKKKARAFLLERTSSNDNLIEVLTDLRILHVLKRGISAKDYPGRRFLAFAVDYGCYVDLLSTKEAPECLFKIDDETPVDVPGEDYRSIRHAVLDLQEYRHAPLAPHDPSLN